MEAYLYEKRKGGNVRCHLCHHRCLIGPNERGICGVRENQGGILKSLVYGKLIARSVDPIEKKPLFHLAPGSHSYSIATVGCNFRCRFCQNADIAQMPSDHGGRIMGEAATPEGEVQRALDSGCRSIAYTYTEPTVYFEFAHDTAKLAHAKGLRNAFVSNGYMTPEALEMIQPYLDAANVDLKAYNDEFYKNYCGGRLAHVKDTLLRMKEMKIWLEVTTLLIPGLNDDPAELGSLAAFIAESLGPETPWHVSRFHPTYKLTDRPPTPPETLTAAYKIGMKAGLKYVYTGNVPGDRGESTFCWNCGELLISRWGFFVKSNVIETGTCPVCHAVIDGIEI